VGLNRKWVQRTPTAEINPIVSEQEVLIKHLRDTLFKGELQVVMDKEERPPAAKSKKDVEAEYPVGEERDRQLEVAKQARTAWKSGIVKARSIRKQQITEREEILTRIIPEEDERNAVVKQYPTWSEFSGESEHKPKFIQAVLETYRTTQQPHPDLKAWRQKQQEFDRKGVPATATATTGSPAVPTTATTGSPAVSSAALTAWVTKHGLGGKPIDVRASIGPVASKATASRVAAQAAADKQAEQELAEVSKRSWPGFKQGGGKKKRKRKTRKKKNKTRKKKKKNTQKKKK
jgi:hypothetical protein